MIGISTAQNITNLIPAIQYKSVDSVILFETSTAKKAKWTDGLKNVLTNRKYKVDIITLDVSQKSDITQIQDFIFSKIKSFTKSIIWNLGGGQKPHQIAIWEIFKSRSLNDKISDMICYTNQDDVGVLDTWKYDKDILTRTNEDIDVNLSAEEIFNVFGFNIKNNNSPIFKDGNIQSFKRIEDLFSFQDFREYLLKLPEEDNAANDRSLSINLIKEILTKEKGKINELVLKSFVDLLNLLINSRSPDIQKFISNEDFQTNTFRQVFKIKMFLDTLRKIIKDNLPYSVVEITENELAEKLNSKEITVNQKLLLEITNNEYNKAAFYFEKIITQRIIDELEKIDIGITEVYANLVTEKNGQIVAEYDVLCVTKKGTIIAFDAKTYHFENKDIDARLYNLEKGSGFYRTFSAVFPFDWNDLEKEWMNPLIQLPDKLNKKRLNFYVINDSTKGNFWIKYDKGKIIEKSLEKQSGDNWIECKSLNNYFQ
jgi:hypothetical protein